MAHWPAHLEWCHAQESRPPPEWNPSSAGQPGPPPRSALPSPQAPQSPPSHRLSPPLSPGSRSPTAATSSQPLSGPARPSSRLSQDRCCSRCTMGLPFVPPVLAASQHGRAQQTAAQDP